MALGLVTTRLLSEFLSVYDYGTYSQILLIISTVSSFTILGMMDGVNFFYCKETDSLKKEVYVSTIFAWQYIMGALSGLAVMLLSVPLCTYFKNDKIENVLIFAALIPVMQNLLNMLQVLLIAVGKAKMLAIRNFIVSVIRLVIVFAVVKISQNIAVILTATLLLDISQVIFFRLILKKNQCFISLKKVNFRLIKEITKYCIPMAVFTMVNSLNRDMDKYLISLMTDTETLAVFANASKILPFDIIMTSFCTVLIPNITKLVSQKSFSDAAALYKLFLEISYITTGILCCTALVVAPQLMNLLYSEKYLSGLTVFCIYIIVDLFRFTNITLVLSAAGKTKWLMLMGTGALIFNGCLNILLYHLSGINGPAVATLITTILSGVLMLAMSAKVLKTKLKEFFSVKYLLLFSAESIILTLIFSRLASYLHQLQWNYLVILIVAGGLYAVIMTALNLKRLLHNIKRINKL